MQYLIKSIIAQYKAVQNEPLWIGSNYQTKLQSISPDLVFVKPTETLHTIAQIIAHLTLWREETILKIKTGKGSKTDQCEENWPQISTLKAYGWQALKHDFDSSLDTIITLLSTKNDSFLEATYYDTDFKDYYPYSFVLYGMLHHDLYHLGQIGIIIKHLKG